MNSDILANIVNDMISNICLLNSKFYLDYKSTNERINQVSLGSKKYSYYSTRALTPELKKLITFIENWSISLCGWSLNSSNLEEEYVMRHISIEWMKIKYEIDLDKNEWNYIFDYIFDIAKRTYENLPSSINLIINLHDIGDIGLNNIKESKILDVLASSNYTFIEVDKKLQLLKYDCIDIGEIESKNTYSDIPDYINPYAQYIKKCIDKEKIGISLSRTGDIIVYNKSDVMLTIRKNRWTIYDNASLKNTVVDILGNTSSYSYGIACNLYDMIWNLSYRRHGALIIVTTDSNADRHIVNKESILSNSFGNELRHVLKSDVEKIDISQTGIIRKKALLMELLSIDGATVIDSENGKVRAYGAIVESHKDVMNVSGARSTAAKSAIRHDSMKPIKISSDGDITLYCKVTDNLGNVHYLEFTFY